MDYAVIVIIELLRGVAGLVLIATGLAIIFGMMRIINIAHGEFLMMGGYTVVLSTKAGVNIWISILVLAPLVVGAERSVLLPSAHFLLERACAARKLTCAPLAARQTKSLSTVLT